MLRQPSSHAYVFQRTDSTTLRKHSLSGQELGLLISKDGFIMTHSMVSQSGSLV